jgi:2-polyprenyl-3-methyl-5-hydroxy-6-metoxy-1,4-benzoquinol methylase
MASCKACLGDLAAAENRGTKNNFALLGCPACGTVTVDPFPTIEQLTAFYQGYKGTTDYKAKKDSKIKRARRRIQKLKKLVSGTRFLDVGCNYGFTVKAALDAGLDAFGIDMDATAVNGSKEMFGPHFETISVQDYAKRGDKADIVYTSEVIEHVPDPDDFVQAIASILPKKGILYLTTPDSSHWRVPKDFPQWKEVMPPEHVTYFTRKGMTKLLEKHGLKVEKFFLALKPGMRLIARKI